MFDKVCSLSRAWQRVLDELMRAISSEIRFRICVMHVNIPKRGEGLMEKLKSRFPEHEVRLFETGAVMQLMSEQVHLDWLLTLAAIVSWKFQLT
ncbi:hypothetical protein ACPUYX_12165 [Desulfosporosinus sp. SYSU MS00001]|uniref:hypothetical protein n=1 Tax=Desulfosporosinus sp. SYSU MS00001 TaxID=3416284 RepID=UPI003CE737C8